MESKITNPLLCDIETGLCALPGKESIDKNTAATPETKAIRVIYFTDPICSSCWGIEPQLRRLKQEYGRTLEFDYRMGGLLPDWSYNSGGISKPADVAQHWDEVSAHYDMPIDGDVWLEDPLSSSFPPSIAFKAAQLQDKDKAVMFLRAVRELLFLQKRNITRWEWMELAARRSDLDTEKLKRDYDQGAKELFEMDLALARERGVRGFPTIFFADSSGNQEKVYGTQPYEVYEQAILRLAPGTAKQPYAQDWESLFRHYPTLTSREYAELSGIGRQEAESTLSRLHEEGKLNKMDTKNGMVWSSGR